MLLPRVDQKGASAGQDLVGRDKITHITYQHPVSLIERLMERLAEEMRTKDEVRDIIDALQLFYIRKSLDGVTGLEDKLLKAGREDELLYAFEKKELFAKALDRYKLYASAQHIFAHILAKAEYEFTAYVHPNLGGKSNLEINAIITERVVDPIVSACGIGPIAINHSLVMGMIYWLAEQCFVRWHQ